MAARIVVTEFVSLDGVMEAPGGEPGFRYPNWTFEFDRGDDGDAFKLEETLGSDGVLLGRRTYESFAGAWPQREGPFAEKLNAMPKFVVSSTLSDPEWSNSTVVGVDDLARLKEEQDGVILVNGSQRLMDALFERDLVDELRLMVFPTVLGNGKQLFGDTGATRTLELVESRPVGPEGVLVLVYRPK